MSLSDPLSENPRIFSVAEKIDSCQLTVVVIIIIPVTNEDVSLSVISIDQDGSPMSISIIIIPKTFSWDGSEATGYKVPT